MNRSRQMNDLIQVEGHVKVQQFTFNHNHNERTIFNEWEGHNLVVYQGRDYLARRCALNSIEADYFINYVGVGRINFPAPDLTQQQLYDLILYHQIDSKTFSTTARGRIEFAGSIQGNEFSTTETIKEAGLFNASYTAPGTVAIYEGYPYMFSRVTFPDPGFTVFPSTGAISQGFLIQWFINY